jgi:hypothetical protein
MEEADGYIVRNAVHLPGIRFKTPVDGTSIQYSDSTNPLNW